MVQILTLNGVIRFLDYSHMIEIPMCFAFIINDSLLLPFLWLPPP